MIDLSLFPALELRGVDGLEMNLGRAIGAFPLAEHQLAKQLAPDGRQIGLGRVHDKFAQEQTAVPHGKRDLDKVIYPTVGRSNRYAEHAQARRLKVQLLAALQDSVSEAGASADWSKAGLLFEFSTKFGLPEDALDDEDPPPDAVQWCYFSCGNAAAVVIPFRLHAIACAQLSDGRVDTDEGPVSVMFEYKRKAVVVGVPSVPFRNANDIAIGMLEHFTIEELYHDSVL